MELPPITESAAMTREVEVVGVDPGKNWFHVIGMDRVGRIVLRRRLNRTQLGELAATLPACRVAMESCPASQYWGRRFVAQGHEVRIIPAQFVKPFVKSNKSDYDDAEAIAEASTRDTTRCVPLKNAEQLDLQATHRVRQRFVIERTAAVNQMRALLLENGLAVPIGRALFARRLPDILADAENVLSIRVSALLQRLRARWLALDVEITEMTALLMQHAEGSELCRRAITVPGVGPIVSTALIATVGNAHAFRRGRDMAAWLGLVPQQHSTAGRTTLGRISKRGNAYLRQLFIQGAQALYTHMKREKSRMGQWLRDLELRAHRHVVVVALANKIVRICWKVLTAGEDYRPFPAQTAP
ncbi:MAG: IS110 family transposase [Acetobacteraceae bacterium]